MAVEKYDETHIYAHTRPLEDDSNEEKHPENYEWEPLEDHLLATAKLAEKYGNKFNAGRVLRAIGLMHDLGKMSKTFQTNLLKKENPTDHVLVGALVNYAFFFKEDDFLVNTMSAVIQGHHDSIDCMMYFDKNKYKKNILNAEYKKILMFADELGVSKCKIGKEVPEFKLKNNSIQKMMYVRMIYSCLKEADSNVTKNFMEHKPYDVMQTEVESFYISADRKVDKKHKNCVGLTIEELMGGLYSHTGMIDIKIKSKKSIPLCTIIHTTIHIDKKENLKQKDDDFKWLFVISMNELVVRYKCLIYIGDDVLEEEDKKSVFRQLKEYVDLDKNFDDFKNQKLADAIVNQNYMEVQNEIRQLFAKGTAHV